ncbi:hypothetical protein CTI12_AA495760 [Artemisia annua]|uniref:Alpha/Beta hydrolase fold protein n=1 Tax=Artemisia annua TaxID=35608 RepID=A0A2U1LFN7_ARTAN|nr:hypothetical protein CTI12_AA495760 [Artemisia annua]
MEVITSFTSDLGFLHTEAAVVSETMLAAHRSLATILTMAGFLVKDLDSLPKLTGNDQRFPFAELHMKGKTEAEAKDGSDTEDDDEDDEDAEEPEDDAGDEDFSGEEAGDDDDDDEEGDPDEDPAANGGNQGGSDDDDDDDDDEEDKDDDDDDDEEDEEEDDDDEEQPPAKKRNFYMVYRFNVTECLSRSSPFAFGKDNDHTEFSAFYLLGDVIGLLDAIASEGEKEPGVIEAALAKIGTILSFEKNWELAAPLHCAKVMVPSKYIVRDLDLAYLDLAYHRPDTIDYVHNGGFKKDVPLWEEVIVMKDVAHWINQEKPHEISKYIVEFLQKF